MYRQEGGFLVRFKEMNDYIVKLKSKKIIAENTLLFGFEKPAGFQFRAGQFLMITLPQIPEGIEKGNSRSMSIDSPPYLDNLEIAIRGGDSPFKVALEKVSVGDKVQIKGSYGIFTLPMDNLVSIVFLVGGIGITPVRSILLQATHDKSSQEFHLFYSNRRPEDSAFLEELTTLDNPNYKFIGTMTKMEESQRVWDGERGFITMEMVKKYILDIKIPLYYIVGSTEFVERMKQMLLEEGIERKKIKLEEFPGYKP